MIEVSLVFVLSVFLAGVLMFLAPCTLPLVPAYLAFISGVDPKELSDPSTRIQAKRKIILNSLTFVLGFSTIFILTGVLLGLAGQFIGVYRIVLAQIGGFFIILFGLYMLGVFNIPALSTTKKVPVPNFLKPGHPASAFGIGATFALGWSPCVGPILASVILLASSEGTVLSGAILLGVFSLGLGIPFLLTAVLYTRISSWFTKAELVTRYVSYIGGLFLVLIGVLLMLGDFGVLVQYGEVFFKWLGLEILFDYL